MAMVSPWAVIDAGVNACADAGDGATLGARKDHRVSMPPLLIGLKTDCLIHDVINLLDLQKKIG